MKIYLLLNLRPILKRLQTNPLQLAVPDIQFPSEGIYDVVLWVQSVADPNPWNNLGETVRIEVSDDQLLALSDKLLAKATGIRKDREPVVEEHADE